MNKANKIIEEIKNEVSQLNKENKGGVLIPLKHFRIILDYIDKLQKQLDKLKEVDRQICCEELITKDKYQDILKENAELQKELETFNRLKNGTTIMFGAKTQYWRKDKIEKYFVSKNKIREIAQEYKPNQSNTFIESQERYIKLVEKLELLGE